MEKTTTIYIAGATFTLTESAHDTLATYLSSLKAHFANDPNQAEILRDIEARIAEKLLAKDGQMILISDVDAIILEIGDPSQLEDQEESSNPNTETRSDRKDYKKLYRDMDEAWIGGIASGIATYFDISPFWVRTLFVISTLFWGASILVYIVLWILIPEAKSTSQKLEMRGVPVSIQNISSMFSERAEEVRKAGTVKKFFTALTHFFSTTFKIFGKAIGFVLTIGSVAAIITTSIIFGAVLTNWDSSFNDFPLKGAVSDNLIFLGMYAAYSAVVLPLILIAVSGIRLIKKRVMMPTFVVLTLVAAWILAVIALGIIGSNIAREYTETLATNPDYQIETRDVRVAPFTNIEVTDDNSDIIIKSGAEQSVRVGARAMEQDDLNITVENGVLKIEDWNTDKNCFFCDTAGARITITTPDLEKISVERSYIQFEDYTDEALELSLISSSIRGSLTVPTLKITAERGNVYTSIQSDVLDVTAKNSYFRIDGAARSAKLVLDSTDFGSELFIITLAETTTLESDVTATILEEITTNTQKRNRTEIED